MLVVFALGTVVHAACTQDLLHEAVGEAEIAFSSADSAAFTRAIGEVRSELDCAGEPIGPSDAAAIHRAEALAAFLDRDEAGVVAHYAAARRIEPNWQLPASLALEDHPLRRNFVEALEIPAPTRRPLPPPEAGWIQVDGVRADEAPADAPFVLQRFDGSGAVVWSGLVPSGGALPPWDVAAVTVPAPVPAPSPVPVTLRRHPARVPLLIGSGVAAVGGALAGWQSARQRSLFWDPLTEPGEIDARMARTNGWGIASVSLGVVFVGTLGSAALVADR